MGKQSIRSHGVVMVITLLGIILIASLLFYVYNVGTSVQGRVVTQHAADASAIGGAGQAARSMNTVAMNNIETTRLIAAISALDSVPLAVDLSVTDATEAELGDVDAVAQAVGAQLRAGVIDEWFERKLAELISASNPRGVTAERDELAALDELFRNQPDLIPDMTWYRAPSGEMGRMHQAMRSMDAQSRAVLEALSETVQRAAIGSARANLGNENPTDAGLLLPVAPSIPWERGAFSDFERPLRFGLLPGQDERRLNVDTLTSGFGQIDDTRTNRGPWDALYGWRATDRIAARSASDGGSMSIPGSLSEPPRPQAPGGSAGTPGREPTEYYVISPESILLRYLPSNYYGRIHQHITSLYSIKSNYLWNSPVIRTIPDTAWEIDIDFDNERSQDRNDTYAYGLDRTDITETGFVIVEMKSRIANNPGLPGTQGVNWNYVTGRRTPRVMRRGGWFDPNRGPVLRINPRSVKGTPTWRKVQDHIWRISAVYETNPYNATMGGDSSIGLEPIRTGTDADGNPTYAAQDVYWEIDVMLIGVNVGEDIEVANPWDGFNRLADDAPAPYDLDHDIVLPENETVRRQYLTFLGVARQSNRPSFWPSRFDGGKAYPYNTAIAQARVYNNHSWDLWTQTWQATLEPVTGFDGWVTLADEAAVGAVNAPELNPEQVRQMADQLRNVSDLAPVMLNH